MFTGEWQGKAGRWYDTVGVNWERPNWVQLGCLHSLRHYQVATLARCLCRHGSRASSAYLAFVAEETAANPSYYEPLLRSRSCVMECPSLESTTTLEHESSTPFKLRYYSGCCAENCYCAPAIGIYLALVLPLLMGPTLYSRVRRPSASAPRVPLLDAMWRLGSVLAVTGVTPTVLSLMHPALYRIPLGKAHRYFGFVPLGITLALLSLRPSLAEARHVVVTGFAFMAYAAAGMATMIHNAANTHALRGTPEQLSRRAVASAMAFAHLVLLVSLLPIVRRGGALWRPTREVAAWRLRRLWSIYRVCMGLVGAWALVIVVIAAADPYHPLANLRYRSGGLRQGSDYALELLYAWGMLVQGVAFSMLRLDWRHRFQLRLRRMHMPKWRSSLDIGRRGENMAELAADLNELHLSWLHSAPEQPAASLRAHWTEDPPSLGQRLILLRRTSGANGTKRDGESGERSSTATPERGNGDGQGHGGGDGNSHGHGAIAAGASKLTADGTDRGPLPTDVWANAVLLGEGGFSVVVGAHLDGAPVALKVAKGGGTAEGASIVEALRKEALMMRRADFPHEHLVACMGTCVVGGCPVLVLQCCDGGNLSEALGLRRPGMRHELAPFEERWCLVPQLASGLSHLHSLGIIHCDIKASNVLLRPSARHALGHAVLSDLGLAIDTADAPSQAGRCAGTRRYLAPEVTALQPPCAIGSTYRAKVI